MGNLFSRETSDQQDQFIKSFHFDSQVKLKNPNQQIQEMTQILQQQKYSFEIRGQIPMLIHQAIIVFKYIYQKFGNEDRISVQNGKYQTILASYFFPQLKAQGGEYINEDDFISRCKCENQMLKTIIKYLYFQNRKSALINKYYKSNQKLLLKENELNNLISLYEGQKADDDTARNFQVESEINEQKLTLNDFKVQILKQYNNANLGLSQTVDQLANNNEQALDLTEISQRYPKTLLTHKEVEFIYDSYLYPPDWNTMFKETIDQKCHKQQLLKSELLFSEEDFNKIIEEEISIDIKLAETIISQSLEIYNKFYKVYDDLPQNQIDENMLKAMQKIYGYKEINAKQLRELQIYF